jgi:transcriptional regulator with XRE-family HTH domain
MRSPTLSYRPAHAGTASETLGTRLEALRRRRGWTQAKLASAAGITVRMLSAYENDRSRPPVATLPSLARALAVSVDELLAGVVPASKEAGRAMAKRPQRRRRRKATAPGSRVPEGFGPRLAAIRKARGLTQAEIGASVGVSQRMIAYYEAQKGSPPVSLLPRLAKTLGVTMDELFGLEPDKFGGPPRNVRLWRKLKGIESLPPRTRRHLLRLIDAFLETEALRKKDKKVDSDASGPAR